MTPITELASSETYVSDPNCIVNKPKYSINAIS